MKRSVHDNHLYAYEVDSRAQRIILRTKYSYDQEPFETTDVIFEGVLDHYFRDTVFPSIISDVNETDPLRLITAHKEVIDQGHQSGGWPSFWKSTVEEMVASITDAGYKTFEISSSYGLDGWVVARSCELRSGSEKTTGKELEPTSL
jgi:hypothetical protein